MSVSRGIGRTVIAPECEGKRMQNRVLQITRRVGSKKVFAPRYTRKLNKRCGFHLRICLKLSVNEAIFEVDNS